MSSMSTTELNRALHVALGCTICDVSTGSGPEFMLRYPDAISRLYGVVTPASSASEDVAWEGCLDFARDTATALTLLEFLQGYGRGWDHPIITIRMDPPNYSADATYATRTTRLTGDGDTLAYAVAELCYHLLQSGRLASPGTYYSNQKE